MVIFTAKEDDSSVYAVWMDQTIPEELRDYDKKFQDTEWVIGFNLPYDLLWMRRYGINLVHKKLWDCQLYHFISQRQAARYPSLNQVAEHWGFPLKLDVVKTEYWDKGLDTDDVPMDILEEYGCYDTELTYKVAKAQMEEFKTLHKNLRKTILLAMKDMSVIVEMMWNGFKYDSARSARKASELQERVLLLQWELQQNIEAAHGGRKLPEINLGSGTQISAILYGGTIKEVLREDYLFHYKDPKKPPVIKSRPVEVRYDLDRIVAPLSGSEMAKEGVFSTDEGTLKSLRPSKRAKKIIDLLLELRGLQKLISTYFQGFLNKIEYYNWVDNVIHSQLSQCVTITGRLASGNPNLQNVPAMHKQCFVSRFKRK